MSKYKVLALFAIISCQGVKSQNSIVKCCRNESVLYEDMECWLPGDVNVTLSELVDLSNETIAECITCLLEANFNGTDEQPMPCDTSLNATLVFARNCSEEKRSSRCCDSMLTILKFWGATIVVLANSIYIFPYLAVVVCYVFMASLHKRAYDRAVMYFCCTQVGTSSILCVMAYFVLCHKPMGYPLQTLSGLSLMFLTISGMLWQLIICLDMTLTITRFQWAPGADNKRRDEDRKFFVYSAWVWGGTALPTVFAAFVELAPFVPRNWVIVPHFEKFDNPNFAVIFYVITIPVLVVVANNVLFFYTTYVIIQVRKSTSSVTQQARDNMMKKYFFFLRLYLMMDTPWLSGSLGAIFPDLWIFKFVRMAHPMLMLIAIMPRETFLLIIARLRSCFQVRKNKPAVSNQRDSAV